MVAVQNDSSAWIRVAMLLLVNMPLIACNQRNTAFWASNQENGLSLSQAISAHQSPGHYFERHVISAREAIVSLGKAKEEILAATERLYENGLEQRIIYPVATNLRGENYIDLRVVDRQKHNPLTDRLILHSNQAYDLQREAAKSLSVRTEHFANSKMGRNRFGTYGMIFLQRSRREGCLFGWQTLRDPDDDSRFINTNHGVMDKGLSYRIRYCSKDLTQQGAQKLMNFVELNGTFRMIWYAQNNLDSYSSSYSYHEPYYLSSVENQSRVKTRKNQPKPYPKKSTKLAIIYPVSDYVSFKVPHPHNLPLKVSKTTLLQTTDFVKKPQTQKQTANLVPRP